MKYRLAERWAELLHDPRHDPEFSRLHQVNLVTGREVLSTFGLLALAAHQEGLVVQTFEVERRGPLRWLVGYHCYGGHMFGLSPLIQEAMELDNEDLSRLDYFSRTGRLVARIANKRVA